jgi:hypothetical protein
VKACGGCSAHRNTFTKLYDLEAEPHAYRASFFLTARQRLYDDDEVGAVISLTPNREIPRWVIVEDTNELVLASSMCSTPSREKRVRPNTTYRYNRAKRSRVTSQDENKLKVGNSLHLFNGPPSWERLDHTAAFRLKSNSSSCKHKPRMEEQHSSKTHANICSIARRGTVTIQLTRLRPKIQMRICIQCNEHEMIRVLELSACQYNPGETHPRT